MNWNREPSWIEIVLYATIVIVLSCFWVLMLSQGGCAPSINKAPKSAENEPSYYFNATLETTGGEEPVRLQTESASTCQWLRSYIKKYGKYAHIVKVEECQVK